MSFQQVSLFGGAIVADYPENFIDVSEIRQVPDNQEIYLQQNGFSSIVIEILEYVDKPGLEALEYHVKDIVDDDAEEMRIVTTTEAHLTKFPTGTPAYTLIATTPAPAQQRGRPNEPAFVAIYVVLVRLTEKKTDIIVTVNVPFVPGEYDTQTVNRDTAELGEHGDRALQVRDRILQTLDIKDWSLFVSDE